MTISVCCCWWKPTTMYNMLQICNISLYVTYLQNKGGKEGGDSVGGKNGKRREGRQEVRDTHRRAQEGQPERKRMWERFYLHPYSQG